MEDVRCARSATRKLLWRWGNTIPALRRLECEREEAQRWANDARDTLRAQRLTGTPRGGGKSDLADVVAEYMRRVEMYDALVKQIDAEIAERIRLRNCMEALVAQLTPMQEKVIGYRYIDGHAWRYISMKMNYDEDHIMRVERQAVDYIAQHVDVHFEKMPDYAG